VIVPPQNQAMRTPTLPMPLFAALAALMLTSACNKEKSPAAGRVSGSSDIAPTTVVATYKGGKVTEGDLEKKIRGQLKQLEDQKYELRKRAWDGSAPLQPFVCSMPSSAELLGSIWPEPSSTIVPLGRPPPGQTAK